MKYIIAVIIAFPTFYTFGFIKYSWKNNNKRAAIGAGILTAASVVLPTVVLLLR